jgi:hypothetical protein
MREAALEESTIARRVERIEAGRHVIKASRNCGQLILVARLGSIGPSSCFGGVFPQVFPSRTREV